MADTEVIKIKIDVETKALDDQKAKLDRLTKALENFTVGSKEYEKIQGLITSNTQKYNKQLLESNIAAAQSAKSIGEMNKAMKALKSAQEGVDASSPDFARLAAAINEVEGRVGDLNDSFRTLTGSGVEKLESSLGLLKEGLLSADPGKMKIGMDGLKAAMTAIPIFLLVEGFKYLADNWRDILKFGKELFGVFSDQEKSINALNEQLENQKEITATLSKQYDREIALLEASGASEKKIVAIKKEKIELQIKEAIITAKLNYAKLQEARNNDSVTESLYKVQAAMLRRTGFVKEAEAMDKVIAISKIDRTKDEVKAVVDVTNCSIT